MARKVKAIEEYIHSQAPEMAKKYLSDKRCSAKSLGKEYGISSTTVAKYLIEQGVKPRDISECQQIYSFDFNYFKKVDTEGKAYFLGLLYADGCTSREGKMTITLHEQDIDILEKIRKEINYNGPFYYKKPDKVWDKKKNKYYNRGGRYTFAITNRELAKDLIKLGCVSAKSLVLKFPAKKQVPNHLLRHFIRGYFDGDGCISVYYKSVNEKNIRISIISTFNFLEAIRNHLKKLEIKTTVRRIPRLIRMGNSITSELVETSSFEAIKFLNWIYSDSSIYLKRKYDKYIGIKETYTKWGKKVCF